MQVLNKFPPEPGTYVIILDLKTKQQISIGKLGKCQFPKGWYAYVGSAWGPGGLGGRLKRHLNLNHTKYPHWHIDHLTLLAEITQIWWEVGLRGYECEWANNLSTIGERIIPNFGSSDCRCQGHLIWFPQDQDLHWVDCIKAISDDLTYVELQPISRTKEQRPV